MHVSIAVCRTDCTQIGNDTFHQTVLTEPAVTFSAGIGVGRLMAKYGLFSGNDSYEAPRIN